MEQKQNNSSNLITKDFFRTELKKQLRHFVTKKDLKNELRNYATEKDLKEEITLLEARIQLMMDNLKRDIDEKNNQYRNELLTTIDPILKEIIVAREDRALTTHRLAELQEKVGNHEERIAKLETTKISA